MKFGVVIGTNANPNKLFKNGANVTFNMNANINYVGGCWKNKTLACAYSIKGKSAYFTTSIGASDSSSEVLFSNQMLGYVDGEEVINYNEINFGETVKSARIDLLKIEYNKKCASIGKKQDIPFIDVDLEETEYNGPYGVSKTPFVPECKNGIKRIIDIQAASIYKRLSFIGINKMVLGISGGLDSTVALLSLVHCCDTYGLDRKNIIG